MKTGRAYGYFAYEGESQELIENMSLVRKRCNFSETFSLTVLEDKITGFHDPKREKLPAKIEELANATRVGGTAPSRCSPKISRELSKIKPVKASRLRYLIMAEYPGATESSYGYGQYGANSTTAGMLGEILNQVGMESASGISRNAVFYLDGRGRAQETH